MAAIKKRRNQIMARAGKAVQETFYENDLDWRSVILRTRCLFEATAKADAD
jgi:hypothetical protein